MRHVRAQIFYVAASLGLEPRLRAVTYVNEDSQNKLPERSQNKPANFQRNPGLLFEVLSDKETGGKKRESKHGGGSTRGEQTIGTDRLRRSTRHDEFLAPI
jgi:hypothetical protein